MRIGEALIKENAGKDWTMEGLRHLGAGCALYGVVGWGRRAY